MRSLLTFILLSIISALYGQANICSFQTQLWGSVVDDGLNTAVEWHWTDNPIVVTYSQTSLYVYQITEDGFMEVEYSSDQLTDHFDEYFHKIPSQKMIFGGEEMIMYATQDACAAIVFSVDDDNVILPNPNLKRDEYFYRQLSKQF